MFKSPDVENLRKNRDVRGLLKALTYKRSAEIRAKAAEAFTRLNFRPDPNEVDVVGPLVASTKDPDPQVRKFALYALRFMALVPPMEVFIAGLQDDNPEVRGEAANSLGRLTGSRDDGRAIQALLDSLKDTEAHVRWRAAQALGKIGDRRVVDALIDTLQDPHPDVRGSAAYSLGELGDKRAIEPLVSLLLDPERWVRMSVETALIQLGKEDLTIACDLCNAPTMLRDTREYDAIEFRKMVSIGLEPPEAAIKQAMLMGVPKQSAIDQWRSMVHQENSAWSLCPACDEVARGYHQVLDPNRDTHRMI